MQRIKKFYQKPFFNEIQGVFSLALQKMVTNFLALAYRIIHRENLARSRRACNKIKKQIVDDGKSVFVFANGPSLSDIDFNKISILLETGKYDLITMNSFLSKSIDKLVPTFAVFADNVHFNAKNSDNQYGTDRNICRLKSIRQFIPVQYLNADDDLQIGYNALCNVYGQNTSDPFRSPGFYGLTALHALRIAKYLGYRNIYICGFDNSYFKDFRVDNNGRMIIQHQHYYDGVESNLEVPCIYSMTSELFFDIYRHFYYIEKISRGASFFNVAKNTYLNCIPRHFELDIYKDVGPG